MDIGVRVAAGITTGALAVLFAQPTDVVKVRLQAGNIGQSRVRYASTLQAYKSIAVNEGTSGLWKGAPSRLFTPESLVLQTPLAYLSAVQTETSVR